MELDDFLKVKKVKLVGPSDLHLTKGKHYTVLGVTDRSCIVNDDNECEAWADMNYFEPVLEPAENPEQGVELTPEFEAVEPVLADNCQVNIQDIDTNILDTNADIKDAFKLAAGEKVYFSTNPDIKTVSDVSNDNTVRFVGEFGWADSNHCCPATQENYEMLCKLYPHIKFEAPPKPLSGDELVRAMLTKGIKNVLCLWGSGDKIIVDRLSYKGGLMSTNCNIVGGVTPIDWYTGEPLTEAVLDE